MKIEKSKYGNTIFHILIARNDLGLLKKELKKYEDQEYIFNNSLDGIKNTLLHKSVFVGDYQITKYLIISKHDLNLKNMHGQTPLHLAYINNFSNIIKLLIESGSNIDIKDNNNFKPKDLENFI